jgi:hypothetical protein
LGPGLNQKRRQAPYPRISRTNNQNIIFSLVIIPSEANYLAEN